MTPEVAAYIATVKSAYQLWISNLAIKERVGIGKNRLMLYIQSCFILGYIKIIDRYYSKTNPDIDNFITKELMDILRGRVDRILRVPTMPSVIYYGPILFTYAGTQLEIELAVDEGEYIIIDWGNGKISTFNGSGEMYSVITSSYVTTGNYEVKFTCSNRNRVTHFGISNQGLSGSIGFLLTWGGLKHIDISQNPGLSGNYTNLSLLTTLEYINFEDCLLTGVVTGWSTLTNLEYINLNGTIPLTGSVASWSTMTKLEEFYMRDHPSINGSIAGWTTMIEMRILDFKNTDFSGSITGFSSMTKLEEIHIGTTSVTGDITGWNVMRDLKILDIDHPAITGTVTSWSAPMTLEYINLTGSVGIVGSITGFNTFSNLYYCNLQGTSVSGDITAFFNCTNLQSLYIDSHTVVGNLVAWGSTGSLDNLDVCQLDGTSVYGDISGLNSLDSLRLVLLYNTDVGWATTVAWELINAQIDCHDCAWTSTEVDNCLISLAAGPCINCTITINGTNASRSAASDAAKAILLANGNTVNVDE